MPAKGTRVYFTADDDFLVLLDGLAKQLGTSRAAVGSMAARIGVKWLAAVAQPETLMTPEMLANMKAAGVFDDDE